MDGMGIASMHLMKHCLKQWIKTLPSSKLTWQWKIPFFNREYIFNWSIFHCHVSLPEGTPPYFTHFLDHEIYQDLKLHRSLQVRFVGCWASIRSPFHKSRLRHTLKATQSMKNCGGIWANAAGPRKSYLICKSWKKIQKLDASEVWTGKACT